MNVILGFVSATRSAIFAIDAFAIDAFAVDAFAIGERPASD
jgi:hypothetical protein